MGVDQVTVQPVVLVVRRALELTGGNDRVDQVAVAVRVAVDLQHVRELVEPADLLHLLEGLRDHGGVGQTDARNGVGLRRQLLRSELRGGVVGLDFRVRDAVRLTRVLDIAFDVRTLQALLVRVDLEVLDDRRIGHTHDQAGQQEQSEGRHRDQRVLEDDVGEEEDRADHRDDGEDRHRGLHRVHVRVGSTERVPAVGEHQSVAVQPVGPCAQQHEEAQQDREVHPGGGGGALTGIVLQPHAAVQVVHDDGGDERQDDGRVQVAEQDPQERVGEREERDVHPELGVGHPEVDAVHELQVGPPVTACGSTGQERQGTDRDPEEELAVRVDGLAVAVQALLFQAHGTDTGPGPVGEVDTRADDDRHDERCYGEQQDSGPQLGQEDRGVADGVEPLVVGPKVRGEHQPRDDDDHGRRDWREQP